LAADSSARGGGILRVFHRGGCVCGQRITVDFDHREILWLGLVEKT
jgi:hypothetical protein